MREFLLRGYGFGMHRAAESRNFERGIASQFAPLIGFGHFDDGDHRDSGWGFWGLLLSLFNVRDTGVNLSSYLACSKFQPIL